MRGHFCFILVKIEFMKAHKEYSPDEALNIYVSFQLIGDQTYEEEKASLEKLIETHVGDIYHLDYEDPEGLPEREIVYRLSKPIILEKNMLRQYFEKMEKLFSATNRFLPAFTQGSEALA